MTHKLKRFRFVMDVSLDENAGVTLGDKNSFLRQC